MTGGGARLAAPVRRRARAAAERLLPRLADRLGQDVLPRGYYSPVPQLEQLPTGFWERPSTLPGVDLRLEQGFRLLEDRLAEHVAAWSPPEQPVPGRLVHLRNGTYETPDAQTLYAMVRHLRPRRVVELGSGASTAVLLEALEGLDADYRVFDPWPRGAWEDGLDRRLRVERLAAEHVGADVFDALREDDVVFIDTSHTVRAGGDVTHLFLEVLPRLAPGVVVHVHDVFLPWPYPRAWFAVQHRYFAEQYLLQAFLAHNGAWEVLLPVHAMTRADHPRFVRSVPGTGEARGGAFWMRRVC